MPFFDQPTSPYPTTPEMPGPGMAPTPPPDAAGPFGGVSAPTPMPPVRLQTQGPYGSQQQPQPGPRAGAVNDRFKMLVPALVAAFGARVGSRGTAALLTGLMRGRDAKMAQQEQLEETQRRRAFEAAEFRKNAVDEMLASNTPEELQAKYSALAEMAEFHGINLQSALAQAAGVVDDKHDETLSKKQESRALDVVKHNDTTNPGQWSAPDESGTMRARDWWVARAGAAGLLPGQAKKTAPVAVGADSRLVDPETGKVIVEPVPKPVEPAAGFTLGEGQVRYGADRKPIAHGPAKTFAPEKPVKGRSVLSSDANRISELDVSLDDLDVLEEQLGKTGAASAFGAKVIPNVVTEFTGWGEDAKSRQGVIDRVKQVIGKALEGGVLRKEDEYKYTRILPTIGDPPAVAKSKLTGLRTAIEQRRDRTVEALTSAGYETDGFTTRRPRRDASAPEVGTKRMINGELGEWDGEQWVAVQ